MKVIQILGPSYCGSTVLGYALNTIDGFFFGSEVRRQLKSFREKSGKDFPRCDYCGSACAYWTQDFLEKTANSSSLDEIYKEFSSRFPQVDFFVDGSKLLKNYENTTAFARVICVKHPLRMLSSQLYNSRLNTVIDVNSYPEFMSKIDEHSDAILAKSKKYLKELSNIYTSFYAFDPDAFVFKSDEAHLHNMVLFDELLSHFECENKKIDILNFSKYACHSLGGNRAPVHLMKKQHKLKTGTNDRFSYYDRTNGFGDWKVDDKYKELLSKDFISLLMNTDEYNNSIDILGYSDKSV